MDNKFKLEIVIIVQFLSCFWPGGCVFGLGSFVVWGHHLRSTFIASRYNYMLNNKYKRGGSWVGHLWFQDLTPLICGFHNTLSGISYPLQLYYLQLWILTGLQLQFTNISMLDILYIYRVSKKHWIICVLDNIFEIFVFQKYFWNQILVKNRIFLIKNSNCKVIK